MNAQKNPARTPALSLPSPAARLTAAAGEARAWREDPELRALALALEAARLPHDRWHETSGRLEGEESARAQAAYPAISGRWVAAQVDMAEAIRRRGGTMALANGRIYVILAELNQYIPDYIGDVIAGIDAGGLV